MHLFKYMDSPEGGTNSVESSLNSREEALVFTGSWKSPYMSVTAIQSL